MDQFRHFGLPKIDPDAPAAARRALAESFGAIGHVVPVADLSAEDVGQLPATLLLGWEYDEDASVSLFAIPESQVSAALRGAFERANGKGWAFDELMYGDDDARAFMLIDVATLEDAEDTLECIEAEVPGFTDGIDDADRNCLAEHRVAYFESGSEPVYAPGAFDKRFVAAYFVRRSM